MSVLSGKQSNYRADCIPDAKLLFSGTKWLLFLYLGRENIILRYNLTKILVSTCSTLTDPSANRRMTKMIASFCEVCLC